jgi:glycosyltransferase involved in cell wall biosynthesis
MTLSKPPELGIGLVTMNGSQTISLAIESILKQTYLDFKLYILDNQSKDDSQDIIKSFSITDTRIVFVIDKKKRNVVDAQKFIFKQYLISHKFCAFVCDDDIYQNKYFEKLIFHIKKDCEIGLVYGKNLFIDHSGKILKQSNFQPIYKKQYTCFKNAIFFLVNRNCVPLFFGIYRVNLLKKLINSLKFIDSFGWDHDNIFLYNFLLKFKVDNQPKAVMYYRQKARTDLYIKRGYRFVTKNFIKEFLYMLIHQLNVSKKAIKIYYDEFKINFNFFILIFFAFFTYFKFTSLNFYAILKKSKF